MIEQLIADADPVDHADPALDPDHPRARALLAAATAAPAARRPRRVPRRLAVAAVAVAAGVVAIADGPAPLPARAAMVQAAQRTADFSSGRIITTGEHTLHSTGFRSRFSTDTRYDGTAVATHHENDEILPDGTPQARESDFRQVDGTLYERRAGEPWRRLGTGSSAPELPAEVQRQTGNRALLDVLARTEGATRTAAASGGEIVRATVRAADLELVPLPSALLPIASIEGDNRPMEITARIDDEGLLRVIEVRHDSDHAHLLWRAEYRDLGVPQEIVAPM